MKLSNILATIIGTCTLCAGRAVQRDTLQGPTVNFANVTGVSTHLASGILYGLPDNQTQIPSSLLSGFGFNYNRAAGAQVGSGFCYGQSFYEQRFASALSNYQLTRSHGGGFVLMLHDLWGFDTTQNSSCAGPGDNNDWTQYNDFLAAVINDVRKNSMQAHLVIDIWNEPDEGVFWNRPISQWVDMYGRGYQTLRAAFSNTVLLSGPTTSGPPSLYNDWWTQWAVSVASNGFVPDQYVWHEEIGDASCLSTAFDGLAQVLAKYNLPERTVNINEYGSFAEQVPAGSAYWISQLERYNAIGLRGNWLGGTELHDLAASLLSKPDPGNYASTGYFPNGDYQVYKYYVKKMTGKRVGTMVSPDLNMDAYATIGTDHIVRVLMGVRPPAVGTYLVTLEGLTSLGLPSNGTLSVRTWQFPTASDVHFGKVNRPIDLGYADHSYSGGSLTLGYVQTDQMTTYAWEFQRPRKSK